MITEVIYSVINASNIDLNRRALKPFGMTIPELSFKEMLAINKKNTEISLIYIFSNYFQSSFSSVLFGGVLHASTYIRVSSSIL